MTQPRVFDKLLVYGERLTILAIHDGYAAVEDDAGLRIERPVVRLVWNEAADCWSDRADHPSPTPVSYLRCSTCGVLLDPNVLTCGFCGESVDAA